MPDLNGLPVPQYNAGQPYHWEYDNLPLQTLADRDDLINAAVDTHQEILRNSAGTAGTLANRLDQSIQDDGNLISSAVDDALHNIAKHADGSTTVSGSELDNYQNTLGYVTVSNPVPFVRMLEVERDKLSLVADEATKLLVDVNTPSLVYTFGDGGIDTLVLAESTSIGWTFEGPNSVKPEIKFSIAFAHRHYYDLEPLTSDYINFQVNGPATPYMENTLRVYINGVRLSSEYPVYVPNSTISTWTANKFTPNYLAGTFSLMTAIDASDIIRIDFDLAVT
jgi:hypothetical protein